MAMGSLIMKNISQFTSSMDRLEPLYLSSSVGISSKQYELIGLNLMRLLSQGNISNFYCEVELLAPSNIMEDKFIKFAIMMEQGWKAGRFHYILNMNASLPSHMFQLFMEPFFKTVRNDIADCIQTAHSSLSVTSAQSLLAMDSEEFSNFVKERNWNVEMDILKISKKDMKEKNIVPKG